MRDPSVRFSVLQKRLKNRTEPNFGNTTSPDRIHPLVSSHLRASRGLVIGPGLPLINALISERVAGPRWDPAGVLSPVGMADKFLLALPLSLSLSIGRKYEERMLWAV
ncbi:hypothetical protein BYT27DRAFT_6795198 [Phlegmacium glaucopus]|nr:hypothetical protein BYT27DRAFT_6795198 [Phlegmacium glaucopus]